MSNELASRPLSIPSTQMSQLEPISNKMDSSMQVGMNGSGPGGSLHQMSISNMEVAAVEPGYSGSTFQQMQVMNMHIGTMLPMSDNLWSQKLPMPNQETEKMDSQTYNLLQQQFFLQNTQLGGLGTRPNNVASQQSSSLNKRKAPMELMSNNSFSQRLSMPNKRVAQVEHRPWLQQTSAPDKKVVAQMQHMSNYSGSQYLAAPNKKVVQKESSPGKSAPRKHSVPKSQNAHVQPSPKVQSESFESVRSKMRESLAAALALVSQQQDKTPNVEKSGKNEADSVVGETQDNSQPSVSASTASGAVEPLCADPKETLPSDEDSSFSMYFVGESASHGYFANGIITNNSQMSKCNGQEFPSGNLLPDEGVLFSDNFFARDELLQGNGLSWEPIEVKKEFPTAEKEELKLEKASGDLNREERQSNQSLQILASKIEDELFKLFEGVNKKYKEKGRSLLFNLKDPNNPELRERVMSGEIPAERLCSMTAEELASKELSQWRMAKAEEMAQMVFLPDSEVDMRRLVKKTHKGEVQVEVERVDAVSADVSIGASSLARVPPKVNETEAASPSKSVGMKDETNAAAAESKSNLDDQEGSCTVTSPSNDGTDLMEGLMVDNELKDDEFLPPVVSLDEFMESLDLEPPFENLPVDAEKLTAISEKDDSEFGSESKSPVQTPLDPVDTSPDKPENFDVTNTEFNVKPTDSPVKSETVPSVGTSKGELVWDGLLNLSISAMAPVIGIFKSGEKTSSKEWASFLDIKGRVRQDAFEKFLQELPMSRSRAVMIVHFVSKEASPKSEQGSISEVADSYVLDGRVGFAEPAPGTEVYFCPPHAKTREMLSKILPKDQIEALNAIDNGLVGVVVWRKAQLTSTVSPNSASHHKRSSKKHSTSRRQQDKDTNLNVNITPKPFISRGRPPSVYVKPTPEEDVDVPPGFGPPPGPGRDDDDLPEFNFSGGSATQDTPWAAVIARIHAHTHTQSRPVDQMRELIQKYEQPQDTASSDGRGIGVATQPWNDDDNDDIPEWQPQAPEHQSSCQVHIFQRTNVDNNIHIGWVQPHQQYRQPTMLLQPPMNIMQSQQHASHVWMHGSYMHPPSAAHPSVCQPSGVHLYGSRPRFWASGSGLAARCPQE